MDRFSAAGIAGTYFCGVPCLNIASDLMALVLIPSLLWPCNKGALSGGERWGDKDAAMAPVCSQQQ